MKIFLGVNLGLGFSNFSLGHHVFNCKGVLGGIGIGFSFAFSFGRETSTSPFFSFGTPTGISILYEGSWVVRGCSGEGRGRAAGGGRAVGSSLISSR